jgi:hypothetical protein
LNCTELLYVHLCIMYSNDIVYYPRIHPVSHHTIPPHQLPIRNFKGPVSFYLSLLRGGAYENSEIRALRHLFSLFPLSVNQHHVLICELHLLLPHSVIQAAELEELLVCALLSYRSMLQYDDVIWNMHTWACERVSVCVIIQTLIVISQLG